MIGCTKLIALIPNRHALSHRRAQLSYHAERQIAQTERKYGLRVMMTDCVDIRSRPVNSAVDDSLGIEHNITGRDRLRGEVKFDDIAFRHQFRGQRPSEKKPSSVMGVPDADMTKSIEHALPRQDAIGRCNGSLRGFE